jgi:hypothetical protein
MPRVNVSIDPGSTWFKVARAYLQRGWSVAPQLPGGKKPCVKWKPYQVRRPTEDELGTWFRTWPTAGIAVVLGKVSGLFVVDVDGPEAHAVLLERLGCEPARTRRRISDQSSMLVSTPASRCQGPGQP